jgi:hypothetical protein
MRGEKGTLIKPNFFEKLLSSKFHAFKLALQNKHLEDGVHLCLGACGVEKDMWGEEGRWVGRQDIMDEEILLEGLQT